MAHRPSVSACACSVPWVISKDGLRNWNPETLLIKESGGGENGCWLVGYCGSCGVHWLGTRSLPSFSSSRRQFRFAGNDVQILTIIIYSFLLFLLFLIFFFLCAFKGETYWHIFCPTCQSNATFISSPPSRHMLYRFRRASFPTHTNSGAVL